MDRSIRAALISLALVPLVAVDAEAASRAAGNRPYVQASDGGAFYARCLPAGEKGTKGTTTVYRVRSEGDEPVDRYEWYAPGGVFLGWSPIRGKVAVLALGGNPDEPEPRPR